MKKRNGFRAGSVFLLIAVMLLGCTSDPTEQTPSASASPTDSRVLVHTPVSTQPKPSQASTATARRGFPTSTITPTRLPTPTLWYGTPVPSAQYQLVDWTPAQAEKLIVELEAYPDTLDVMERGRYDSGYYYAYHFASLAEVEAAYRFPESEQAETWLWASAYNWLQSYRSNVGPIYSRLIVEALNQGKTNLMDIKSWFEGKEPRLVLDIDPLQMLDGYVSNQILFISVKDSDVDGGTYFWLLENQDGFSIYPLESDYDYGMLDFETRISLYDLTGDGVTEAIITHIDWGSFSMHSGSIEIYDLTSAPPQELFVNPVPPNMDTAVLTSAEGSFAGVEMQIPIDVITFGCGKFGPTWNYRWDGKSFQLASLELPSEEEMLADPRCADILIYDFLLWYLKKDILVALPALNGGIENYPYLPDATQNDGSPIPSSDEIRFQAGLFLASFDHFREAEEQWNLIVDDSEWEPAAQKALSAINASHDFFNLCLEVQTCPDYFYFDQLVDLIPAAQYNDLTSTLTQLGINILQSGTYDFYHDGENEPWILLDGGNDSYFFSYFTKNETQIIIHGSYYLYTVNPPGELTITLTEEDDDKFTYTLSINEDTEEQLQVAESTDITPSTHFPVARKLKNIEQDFLYSNGSLEDFISELTEISNEQYYCENYYGWSCDIKIENEYLLALAYELQGNDEEAISRYYTIWTSYPDSPYAVMAAAKLTVP